jgi:hypothetical protein
MSPDDGSPDLDAYAVLAGEGPTEAVLGHAFLTLVEPHAGHDGAYTRWYEDDHFHAGAMAFPWWFSGRRWVATRALRDLRESSDPRADLDRGWSFATYWITGGRLAEQAVWLETTVGRLLRGGRMFSERSHVMTGYHDHVGEWQAAGHGPRGVHALEYPYAGLVMEVVDLGAGRDAWLVDEHVRPRLDADEASQCLAFAPVAWPGRSEPSWFDYAATPQGGVVLLWFLERDPRTGWAETFGTHRDACESAGGRVAFLGGFVPTLPGTDTYLDEVR